MQNQDRRNIMYLPIHMQELKSFLKIMEKHVKKMKKLKRMITDENDLKAFKASTKRLKRLLQDFQRKLGEFKKEDVQGFLVLRIKELRKVLLIKEAETCDDDYDDYDEDEDDDDDVEFETHVVQLRGIGLSHCLLKSLWVVMLMSQEKEKQIMIEKVIYLLEQLSFGENDHSSSVMNFFISVVGNGAEYLDFAREKKMVSSSDQKKETDQLLGMILNEIFGLEVVFNYPSLYSLIVFKSISLDDIVERINRFNANLSNYISDEFNNEIEDMWEKLELPRTESMAIENNGENNCIQFRNNVKRLKKLIDSMKEETNKVKELDRLIKYFLDVKEFEAAIEQLDEQVEFLKEKVQVMAVQEAWEED